MNNDKIWVTPTSKFNCQSFPIIEDRKILVTEQDLIDINDRKKCFDVENNCVIDYNPDEDIEVIKVRNKNRIVELKQWFDTYYAQHEQKYRRLIDISKLCDDGESPKDKLYLLYLQAEEYRKEIQILEGNLKVEEVETQETQIIL